MKDILQRYWWAWLAGVNLAAVGAIAMAYDVSRPAPDIDVPMEHGTQIHEEGISVLDRHGAGGWANALLYFPGKAAPGPAVDYLHVVATKHAAAGLGVFIVLPPGSQDGGAGLEIVDERGATLHRALNAPWDHDHPTFVVLSRNGVVQFHNFGLPREDILRQLAERFASGTVVYDAGPEPLPQLFRPDLPVPELALVGASDGQARRLTPGSAIDATIILLGAPCAPCQLSVIGQRVSEMVGSARLTANVIVIAAPHFNAKQVSDAFAAVPLAKVYVLAADTPGYDRYATRTNDPDLRPWVLRTDSEGRVRSSERLVGL